MPTLLGDSALVHHVDLTTPGTHVIVIGIGRYDHLPGGSGRKTKHDLNLQQLTSPPASARAVASWFIEHFDCTEAPLADVSLIMAEAAPKPFVNPRTNESYSVPDGSFKPVKQALKDWMKRAEVNPKNRLILYFSGHGVSAGLQNYYLLSDYGEDDDDPLAGAINFRNFLTGLSYKLPTYQFLLFDACRSQSNIIELNSEAGQSIFFADPAGRLQIPDPVQQCPVFSTELDGSALGRPSEPSLCARAFIRSMDGACSRKEGSDWFVTTHQMVDALTGFQQREAQQGDKTQAADANSFAKFKLRKLSGRPRIPVFVKLDDGTLSRNLVVAAEHASGSHFVISDPAAAGWKSSQQWETALEIGEYDFTARWIGDPAKTLVSNEVVWPTQVDVSLEVGKRWPRST